MDGGLSNKATKDQALKNTLIAMVMGRSYQKIHLQIVLDMSPNEIRDYESAIKDNKELLTQETCKSMIEGIKFHKTTLEKSKVIAEQFDLTIEQALWLEIKLLDKSLAVENGSTFSETCIIIPRTSCTKKEFRDKPISDKLRTGAYPDEEKYGYYFGRSIKERKDYSYCTTRFEGWDDERFDYCCTHKVYENQIPLESDTRNGKNVYFNYTIIVTDSAVYKEDEFAATLLNIQPNDFFERMRELYKLNSDKFGDRSYQLTNVEICKDNVCMPIKINGHSFLIAAFIAQETIKEITEELEFEQSCRQDRALSLSK